MIPKQPAECDLRSAYCAAAITFILTFNHQNLLEHNGYSIPKLVGYIKSCRAFAGGFGDPNNFESHSGMTYCATAALKLLNQEVDSQLKIIEFCILRQNDSVGGF